MTDWKQIRRQFAAFDHSTYVNTAATGLVPKTTIDLMHNMYTGLSNYGASVTEEWVVEMENIRVKLADFIGAEPGEVAILPNMATALGMLAPMFKSKKRIGFVEGDFPSLRHPWLLNGFECPEIPAEANGHYDLELLGSLNTKMLAVSHVQWHTGFKIDLDDLRLAAKKKLLVVDATQSCGTCPIDVRKHDIDIMVASCYKWMMCGFGACIVYVKKELLEKFPSAYCWQFRAMPEDYFTNSKRFEIGHERHDVFFRMGLSLDFFKETGMDAIESRVRKLSKYLYKKCKKNNIKLVSDYEKAYRSQIAIIEAPAEMQAFLEKRGILTSHRGTGIRVSLHFYNNKKDVDRLVKALVEYRSLYS